MTFKRLIFLAFISICTLNAYGGDVLNYSDKSITKVLVKNGIEERSSFEEMSISDTIAMKDAQVGKFYSTKVASESSGIQYMYIGRVSSCRAGTCAVHEDISEYFDYMMLFDQNKRVVQVKIFNYQATHGQEITAKSWLKQFIGYQGDKNLEVNKTIDSISGATISTHAITADINKTTKILQQL